MTIDQALSRMSHDLRTPLNSIIGFAQLLELEDLDDTQRDYAHRILTSGRQLAALIDELLQTAAAPDQPAPAEQRPTVAVVGAPGTVLYIEDNVQNQRLVEEILTMRPEVTLLTATDGATGLEVARRALPDLLLLDLHLPDISGSDVLAAVRDDPALVDVPVVVLSADATNEQVQRLLDRGAQAYMTKPLDIPSFLAAVDDYLRRD